MVSLSELHAQLDSHDALREHPAHDVLLQVLTGETNTTSAGYPYICEESFYAFTNKVPHLFTDGDGILDWVARAEARVAEINAIDEAARESIKRSVKVLRNMVFTAGVTAPSDLWLLRQLLGTHHQIGLAETMLSGATFHVQGLAEALNLSVRQLQIDCDFLHARGFLIENAGGFSLNIDPAMRDAVAELGPLPEAYRINLVAALRDWLQQGAPAGAQADLFADFFTFEAPQLAPDTAWFPNRYQIELGYRLLPLVLALRALEWTGKLKRGVDPSATLPTFTPNMHQLLVDAGLVKDGAITALGARVFQRGPGPFGIIGAYYPYMNTLEQILHDEQTDHWVSRGENVAASQDANRKTFTAANDALDDFCTNHNFRFNVFIEHAVGKGEATRQRFERQGEEHIRYFGADLEDAAIDEAVKQQEIGVLPGNMSFIRNADIGLPEKVTSAILEAGLPTEGAVMMVGNGFHEIRNQTNEKMLDVFRRYRRAGIILIFTEETALSDQDLLNTAWNTYHAGFRYVHDMSGQGLRPSWESEAARQVWSWRKCARLSGYHVVDRYTSQTRTIYPTREPGKKNPSISVTYFCVPKNLAARLNLS